MMKVRRVRNVKLSKSFFHWEWLIYLESVHKVSASFRMFEFKACEVFKTKEFTFVNDCFKDEHNEEIGHYGQALFSR